MDKKTANKLIVLFIFVLVLLGLALVSQSYVATIDVEPVFTGNAAFSGHVVSVTMGEEDTVVAPISFHGKNVYLIPNGMDYDVEWTANVDLLGLGGLQSGENGFVAGTDAYINFPVIPVSYTVQATLAIA